MKKRLKLLGVLGLALFGLMLLLGNISYPLLWNDEAETAVYAQRILRFGYPKVFDGKNILYLFEHPNKDLAVKEGMGAYIGSGWTQYYLATIGEFFAGKISDIYVKTALLRLPFALIGLLGVVMMGLAIDWLFNDKLQFWLVFLLFTVSSVPLILHLREVRYYSLLLFFMAGVLYSYIRHHFGNKMSYLKYCWCLAGCLSLVFYTFFPAYIILAGTIVLYELFGEKKIKSLLPIIISGLLVLPGMIFFETSRISIEISSFLEFGWFDYFYHIFQMMKSALVYEFLLVVLFIKVILFKKGLDRGIKGRAADFLGLLTVIYVLLIARTPYMFERYFIVLQPVLVLILILEGAGLFELKKKDLKRALVMVLLLGLPVLGIKVTALRNRLYEVGNRYLGPLDVVIPYIRANYDRPGDLLIATNYEEAVYMYYLDSRMIVGYIENDLESDLSLQPDVIVPRRKWKRNLEALDKLRQRGDYKQVLFSVFDSITNSIPETSSHLYKTRLTKDKAEMSRIYIRRD
ncbi:hypothetical protein KJ953_01600 [Patescibacteria group bacterium]|nr:hypothetical protein [Patescibacteria group bacterium]